MPASNLERYRAAIDAWNRRDLVAVLEQTAADFEFHTSGLFPEIEPVYRGREGMVEFWNAFIEAPWALLQVEIDELTELDDDRVLALLTFTGKGRSGGEEVTVQYAHLCTFRDGQVARIDSFADWDEARDAAGLPR
ncbi:MAG TPA: nuclear transport factor 2 family protein [Solirubrobacterales bacterium]|jgi:ketosteroid isomerase-like protein|nr:nuclear transport factor 2 family protein [Solirubrobacterales bacterium]